MTIKEFKKQINFFWSRIGQIAEGVIIFSIFFAACVGLKELFSKDIFFSQLFIWSVLVYLIFFTPKTILGAYIEKKNKTQKESDRLDQLELDVEEYYDNNHLK